MIIVAVLAHYVAWCTVEIDAGNGHRGGGGRVVMQLARRSKRLSLVGGSIHECERLVSFQCCAVNFFPV